MGVKSAHRLVIEALAVDETLIFDDEYLYRCALQVKRKRTAWVA